MLENTTYIALSRQMAMRHQLDVIANNMANMDTTAFKGNRILFEEYLVDAKDGSNLSFVQDVGTVRNATQGEISRTDNPLDIAITGRGYLVVGAPEGDRYTRNGHLRVDEAGVLVTQEGLPILSDAGTPLVINPADRPRFAKDGTMSGDAGLIGRLQIVSFENEHALTPIGASLYATEQRPTPAEDTSVEQGMIENSNVEPIIEITAMIELLRSYQSTQSMMQREDELRRRAIRQLGQIG